MAGITGPRPAYLRSQTTAPGYRAPYSIPSQTTQNQGPMTQAAPTPQAPKPTFEAPKTGLDPAAAILSQSDPRIKSLLDTLTGGPKPKPYAAPQGGDLQDQIRAITDANTGLSERVHQVSQPSTVAAPDFSRINDKTSQIQSLLTTLMNGGAPSIGDVSQDPAAIAYRVSRERDAARERTAEADRLGASGASGSGDFDARGAQIRERAGEDVASFTGNLASQRRNEAISSALAAAGQSSADLNREAQTEQARYDADLNRERMNREGVLQDVSAEQSINSTKADQLQRLLDTVLNEGRSTRAEATQGKQFDEQAMQSLLAALLGEQGRVQSQATGNALTEEQLRRQEIERGKLYRYPVENGGRPIYRQETFG